MSLTLTKKEQNTSSDRAVAPRRRVRKPAVAGRRRPWLGLAYLAPGLLVYAVVVLVPAGQGVWLSFFHWNGITAATWELHRVLQGPDPARSG